MQSANNAIRPSSGGSNGVWLSSNAVSPQPQAILYSTSNKAVFQNISKRRLERLLLICGIFIFLLFVGLCIAIYFVAEMGEKGDICFEPDCIKAAAVLLNSMDVAVDPCDNFYEFACGNWRRTHPASDPLVINNWFLEVFKIQKRDSLDYLTKENNITEEPGSVHDARLVFKTCLDFDSMEETGLPTFWDLLDNIGLPRNPLANPDVMQPWIRTLAKARRYVAMNLIIGSGILPSTKNSSIYQLFATLPDDESVLGINWWRWDNKEQQQNLRKKVKDGEQKFVEMWYNYAGKLMKYVMLMDVNTTTVSEEDVNSLVSTLLDIQREVYSLHDNERVREGGYFEVPDVLLLKDLQYVVDNATNSGTSKIKWKQYFETIYEDVNDERIDFSDDQQIVVGNIPYFELISKLLEETDDKVVELFIWWNVIFALAPHINEEMKEMKDLFSRKMFLSVFDTTRSQVCNDIVSKLMKYPVGYQVKNYADPKAMSAIKDMLNNVRGSFTNFIFALNWMDEPTKYATVEKLYSMKMYIGYPLAYNDWDFMDSLYRNVTLGNSTHLKNILNLLYEDGYNEFILVDQINDSSDYFFDALEANAFYDPSANAIIVPYGILKQPFYRMGLEALNYGAIGSILGHEITHGLDNTGRKYDSLGNYRTWWSNYSSEEYIKRESCYEELYSNFYFESINSTVNGALTLGENIADDGGIRDSLAAYRSLVKKRGRESKLPGLMNYTHDQLFFISFANLWCSEYSDEALRRSLNDDEHSPNFVRVLIVLQNLVEFSESWKCPKGSFMNPTDRCKLWT